MRLAELRAAAGEHSGLTVRQQKAYGHTKKVLVPKTGSKAPATSC